MGAYGVQDSSLLQIFGLKIYKAWTRHGGGFCPGLSSADKTTLLKTLVCPRGVGVVSSPQTEPNRFFFKEKSVDSWIPDS